LFKVYDVFIFNTKFRYNFEISEDKIRFGKFQLVYSTFSLYFILGANGPLERY